MADGHVPMSREVENEICERMVSSVTGMFARSDELVQSLNFVVKRLKFLTKSLHSAAESFNVVLDERDALKERAERLDAVVERLSGAVELLVESVEPLIGAGRPDAFEHDGERSEVLSEGVDDLLSESVGFECHVRAQSLRAYRLQLAHVRSLIAQAHSVKRPPPAEGSAPE